MCQVSPLSVAPIHAAFLFDDQIRDALHALKYRGGTSLVTPLAPRMAEAWRARGMQCDLLVPVPLHPKRETQRGYNQAALLARALGREIRVPIAEQALARTRNTVSQTHLNRQERRQNVDAAFVCEAPTRVAGRHVTLVDDVATTGATLDACAVTLLAQGAQQVSAFTLARAP